MSTPSKPKPKHSELEASAAALLGLLSLARRGALCEPEILREAERLGLLLGRLRSESASSPVRHRMLDGE